MYATPNMMHAFTNCIPLTVMQVSNFNNLHSLWSRLYAYNFHQGLACKYSIRDNPTFSLFWANPVKSHKCWSPFKI